MKDKSFKKLRLPDKSGVYFFKKGKPACHGERILYIGKATSLRDRVRSYMSKDILGTRGPIIERMVEEADKIDWQVTDSILEAFILEAKLIKKHQPKYNTKEKSDKSFNCVCITKEKIPKVIVVRGRKLPEVENFSGLTLPGVPGGTYAIRNSQLQAIFGPFTSGSQLKEALKIIRKIFPFLDDKGRNYIEFYRQMNLIPDLNDRTMYLQNIKKIKLFLGGRKQEVFKNLKKEMSTYAKMHEFEKAGEIKRQLFALKHINDIALLKQDSFASLNFSSLRTAKRNSSLVKIQRSFTRIEAYDIAHMSGKNMVGVMTVVEGEEVVKSEYKKFKIKTQNNANDTAALAEILERRLAHQEWAYPNLIVVDGGVAQMNTARKVLEKMNVDIAAVSVVKDDRHKPKAIMGEEEIVAKYKRMILLANSEAHRFAIAYHKRVRSKSFLK